MGSLGARQSDWRDRGRQFFMAYLRQTLGGVAGCHPYPDIHQYLSCQFFAADRAFICAQDNYMVCGISFAKHPVCTDYPWHGPEWIDILYTQYGHADDVDSY